MAQHDYSIANQGGAAFRTDLNNALAAILSNNSGTGTPAVTSAYMFFQNSISGVMGVRNSANSATYPLYTVDSARLVLSPSAGSATNPCYAISGALGTGMFSPATNAIGWSVNGQEVLRIGSTGTITFANGTAAGAGQIQFPTGYGNPVAQTNTLDCYNETTFTVDASWSAGTVTGLTKSRDTVSVMKVGRLVSIQGRFTLTSKGATSDATTAQLRLESLPTEIMPNSSPASHACPCTYWTNVAGASNIVGISAILTGADDHIYFYKTTTATGQTAVSPLTWSDLGNGFDVIFGCAYMSAS